MTAGGALLLEGGVILDANGVRVGSVTVVDGRIVAVGEGPAVQARRIDCTGAVVMPGLVDLHCHMREPGDEQSETVQSASRAAAAGGFSVALAMPNTEPAIDSVPVVEYVRHRARGATCRVEVAGAITVGRAGQRLAPLAEMAAAGVRLFTDDGRGVQSGHLMRRALEYARGLGVVLAQHCEDEDMAGGGIVHEGSVAAKLGLPGQPAEAEELMVARDIALCQLTRGRLHLQHLSTARSAELVAAAREKGLAVTAEVTPHHLCLSDTELNSLDPRALMKPPLRPDSDRMALWAALRQKVIGAIATDHAPHRDERKQVALEQAAFGTVGLETALAAVWTETVAVRADLAGEPSDWAMAEALAPLVAAMSWQPAEILGLGADHDGVILAGKMANLAVFDPRESWLVGPATLASRSANSAFAGRRLRGRIRHCVYQGVAVYEDGKVME